MDQPFDKAEAALDLYKSRDCSEKLFRGTMTSRYTARSLSSSLP